MELVQMKYDINLKIGSKCVNIFVLVLILFKLFKLYIFISIIPYWVVIKKQTDQMLQIWEYFFQNEIYSYSTML